jgi:hypothetical protein
MTGGLINIISYGADDLYLTGAPEITFFKVVYRRYMNFSKESVALLLGNIDFGKTIEIEIQQIGDLISNMYLEIDIPEINIKKTDMVADLNVSEMNILETPYNITYPSYVDSTGNTIEINFISDYEKVKIYMGVNMAGYRKAYSNKNIKNQTVVQYINTILEAITSAEEISQYKNIISEYEIILNNAFNYEINKKNYVSAGILSFKYSDISYILNSILNSIQNDSVSIYGFTDPNQITNEQIYNLILSATNNCQIISEYYFDNAKLLSLQIIDLQSPYSKFAWVERLGHSIIDYVEIRIGSDIIDKHYGEWINLWVELAGNYEQKELYSKMIGHTKEMITFDRNSKPKYNIYIPLSFWFSKNNGLAFPLVALQFNKFYVNIKLKNIEDCAYIEKLPTVDQQGNTIDFTPNTLSLSDIWNNLNLSLSGNLYVDYIYIETQERKRFAQSAHEYLIESVELTSMENISDNKQVIELGFTGPSKEIFILCQKTAYINNYTTETNKSNLKSHWFNYTTNINNGINPLSNIKLSFSGYEILSAKNNFFMNYLQPYAHHKNSPSVGINVYSFALFPEEHQPSGSCNFTRITYPLLTFDIDNNMFKYNLSEIDPSIMPNSEQDITQETEINIKVYSLRLNVLRVMHGFAAKAYH